MIKVKEYIAIFLLLVFIIPAVVLPFHIINHHGSGSFAKSSVSDCGNSCAEAYSLNENEISVYINAASHADHCKLCDFSVSPFLSVHSVFEQQINLPLKPFIVGNPSTSFILFNWNNKSLRAPPVAL